MYTDFYKFREKPFNIVPDPGYLYLSSKHRTALTYLRYGVREGTGFILLTGEVGIGKTTLVKHLLDQLDDNIEVAVLFNTNVSADQLLEMILNEFEVEAKGSGKTQYLQALNEFLIHKYGSGQRALLIVDEAQNLTGEALEEIRMLSNLHSSKDLLLQIVLVGQPDLQVKLANPSLYQLRQRIAVRYHLERLSQEEMSAYIAHRLKVAGGGRREIFTPSALAAIFQHADGIPRKANILCDAALVYGFADELETIDADVIEQVVRDDQSTGLYAAETPSSGTEIRDGQVVSETQEQDFSRRIRRLEEQVMHLSSVLDAQGRTQKGTTGTKQETLVKKLTAMLEHERKKNAQLIAKYNKLKDRLRKLEAEKNTNNHNDSNRVSGRKTVRTESVNVQTQREGKTNPPKEEKVQSAPRTQTVDPIYLPSYNYYREDRQKKRFPRSIMNWFKTSKKL